MDEVDYNKIPEELLEQRKNRKSLVGGYSQGIEPINFDYASLYPRTMTMSFPGKNNIRKKKIRNIFPDIE
jgi:hypothetical protein